MKYLIFLIPFLFFLGCSADRNMPVIDILSVDPEKSSKFDITDRPIENRMIKPETNDNSLVGNIQSIFIADNLIGFRTLNNVQLFSISDGSHICSVDNKGRGPNEYNVISYISYDKNKNALVVVDNSKKKMITFDLSGLPVEETKINYSITSIEQMKHFKLICRDKADAHNREGYVLNIFKDGREEKYIPYHYTEGETIFEMQDPVTVTSDTTFFYQSLINDTLYYYDGKSLYPRFIMNYIHGSLPKVYKQMKMQDMIVSIKKNKTTKIALSHKVLFEKDDYIALSYYYDEQHYFCKVNKSTKESQNFRGFFIGDFDLSTIADKRFFVYPYFILVFETAIKADLTSEQSGKIQKYLPDLAQALEKSDTWDNPIILLVDANM